MASTAQENSSSASAPALKVALLGFGTVGSAAARILSELPAGAPLKLAHVFNRNVERKRAGWAGSEVQWSSDIETVLASDADIVVELVGGVEPARQWVRRALAAGKCVVTANKQLIATHGAELSALAAKHNVALAFGASVAGGIPVIDALQQGLAGDQIFRLSGILNGTCNFILTKMEGEHVTFAEALRQAQECGFAEADPTDDVDGYDARAKLAILTRVGLHAAVKAEQIPCRSIRPLSEVDFSYVREAGCTIRQISRAERRDGHIYASVQPALVPIDSPMAHIVGSLNMLLTNGKFGFHTGFTGHGAGGRPTAVAIVSDLLEVARNYPKRHFRQVGAGDDLPVSGNFSSQHYLRFTVRDRPGIVGSIANALATHGINIDSLLQKSGYDKDALPFVITLEHCTEQSLTAAMDQIQKFDFLVEPPLTMPILTKEL